LEAISRLRTCVSSASVYGLLSPDFLRLLVVLVDERHHEFSVGGVQKGYPDDPEIMDVSSISSLIASLTEPYSSSRTYLQ
jgi:hypothetical protein